MLTVTLNISSFHPALISYSLCRLQKVPILVDVQELIAALSIYELSERVANIFISSCPKRQSLTVVFYLQCIGQFVHGVGRSMKLSETHALRLSG